MELKMKMDRGGRTRSLVRRVEYQIPSGDHLYLMEEVRFCDLMDPLIGKNVSAATSMTFFQQTWSNAREDTSLAQMVHPGARMSQWVMARQALNA